MFETPTVVLLRCQGTRPCSAHRCFMFVWRQLKVRPGVINRVHGHHRLYDS